MIEGGLVGATGGGAVGLDPAPPSDTAAAPWYCRTDNDCRGDGDHHGTASAHQALDIPATPVGDQLRWTLGNLAPGGQPPSIDEINEYISAECASPGTVEGS